ncbi:VOC family protein [Halobellus marinus]|uniref:VOC family protein n=1 Tax=Halobellus TaxID=1073986 RepID=UPI0028B0B393|nr:VOC family protein [Halobellus sp. DFY28]
MNATEIDHAKLLIPDDGIETACAFYRDALGFGIEGMERYESGEKPFFSVRLAPGAVLHLEPDESFEEAGGGYDHIAVRVDDTIDGIEATLEDAGVEIERHLTSPVGATGVAPAVYVVDPFGYRIELKAERE